MILGEAFSTFCRNSFPKNIVAYLEEPPHRKNTCRLLGEWLAQMRHLLVIRGRGVVKSNVQELSGLSVNNKWSHY